MPDIYHDCTNDETNDVIEGRNQEREVWEGLNYKVQIFPYCSIIYYIEKRIYNLDCSTYNNVLVAITFAANIITCALKTVHEKCAHGTHFLRDKLLFFFISWCALYFCVKALELLHKPRVHARADLKDTSQRELLRKRTFRVCGYILC